MSSTCYPAYDRRLIRPLKSAERWIAAPSAVQRIAQEVLTTRQDEK